MNTSSIDNPERFWAEVLSQDPDRIRAALHTLTEEDAAGVVEHLRRMVTEDGWQDGQRQRAQAALAHLGKPGDSE
jgi:hypothetical protein